MGGRWRAQCAAQTDARLRAPLRRGRATSSACWRCARARSTTLVRDGLAALPAGRQRALALFAVGGYGRGELFPQSDIDLLVLGRARRAAARTKPALARFFALLWDAGLPASHAVRSAAQCIEAARRPDRADRADRGAPAAGATRRRLHALHAAVGAGRRCGRRASSSLAKRDEQRAAPRALRRHRRQPRAEHQGRPGRPARPAHAGLDGAARVRRARPAKRWWRWASSAPDEARRARSASGARWRACASACTWSPTAARSACASITRRRWPRGWASTTTRDKPRGRDR